MIVTFAVGNSDDKLSQDEWSQFLAEVHVVVDEAVRAGARVQFGGFSAPDVRWQNALWAIELPRQIRAVLRGHLRVLAHRYRQDWIAWWEAEETEALRPAAPQQVR